MRGGVLPAALLCAAVGLMLAFAPRRVQPLALASLVAIAIAATWLPVRGTRVEAAFLACWACLILACLAIHLPRGVPFWLAVIVAGGAGIAAGAVIAGEGARSDLLRVLPCALVALPARWIVDRGWQIAVKVVSSWLIAVALLAALLPTMTKTPGYVPDHMD